MLEFPDGDVRASVVAEIRMPDSSGNHEAFYDFDTKYLDDVCEFDVPAKLDDDVSEELRALAGSDEIIGASEAIMKVLAEVKEVAATDATVLLLGETGTGKELIARAIHRASRRGRSPLIRVNCAAVPSSLIESEFFGHEQGAFTGATKKRDGRFAPRS